MTSPSSDAATERPWYGVPLPALRWLRVYNNENFRHDLIAGTTLAAFLVPASIGDASLAGLPPEAGLYACLFSGFVFWLVCSSKHTAIAVTSAISLLIGSTLGELAAGDVARFAALASATALLVAAIGLIAWFVRAGAIVRFISEGVMVGFKCGVALVLASTQLPKLFGVHGAHGNFRQNAASFARNLDETNVAALIVGLTTLTLLIAGKTYFKRIPVALFVVIGGIVATRCFNLEAVGVTLLGEVPQGIPAPGPPAIAWSEVNELLPLALACFLLGAVETAAIGRMFAAKHGLRLDANQEFLAISAANLAAGLGHGFPVSGGMSQSLVNEEAGARTPVSGLIAAAIVLLIILFVAQLLEDLPQPVLGAVVLAAVTGLFNLSALRHFWREDRREFVVAAAALVAVLASGLLRGVLIGCVISLVQLIHRASQPHVALLGRIPGTLRFSDRQRHPENEVVPGVAIFRPESALVYFNIDYVRDHIISETLLADEPVKLVVLDLSGAPFVDLQGAHGLGDLADELAAAGIRVQAVEARSTVRDRLRGESIDAKLGGLARRNSVHEAVDDFQRGGRDARRLPQRWSESQN
ncbi:MAG: sulfate permease [Planctomycetaceae bacterium]|nr:sulfate permease [Planctomycetaceae bacterium]